MNHISEEDVEAKLKAFFGLQQVLWLNYGYLAGDDTDSHVDTLARLCDKSTIAYVRCEDMEDEHFDELKKMKKELRKFKNLEGRYYRLIPLPMADAIYEDGERLPATYANFLIINGAVLIPTYNSPKDEIAKEQLQKAFPDREIVGIDCRALIKQHGSLHCVTMQYI
jgi:agmatine deiminase